MKKSRPPTKATMLIGKSQRKTKSCTIFSKCSTMHVETDVLFFLFFYKHSHIFFRQISFFVSTNNENIWICKKIYHQKWVSLKRWVLSQQKSPQQKQYQQIPLPLIFFPTYVMQMSNVHGMEEIKIR